MPLPNYSLALLLQGATKTLQSVTGIFTLAIGGVSNLTYLSESITLFCRN